MNKDCTKGYKSLLLQCKSILEYVFRDNLAENSD